MSDNGTYDQLVAQCEGISDALEWLYTHNGEQWDELTTEAREGIDKDDVAQDGAEYVDIMDYIGDALDVEIHGHYNRDAMEWEADYVEILFTCGGPDVRFSTEHGGCVTGRWGSDKVDRSVSGDVGRYLDELLTEGL